jgi:hypothetical protein
MNSSITYSFKWKQTYPAWDTFVTSNLELLLSNSDLKEAKELIKRIKNGNASKT